MDPRQIVKRSNERMITVDLESELLQNRILFITDEICAETVATYQAELIYLASQITDKRNQAIKIYINSPGGSIYSLLGLYDVMQQLIEKGFIIQTKAMGLAASAASVILMAGSKGYRSASPHSRVMIHQPSSITYGKITDMKIDLEENLRIKKELIELYRKHTGHDLEEMMERDKWLTAEEAKELGLIDEIK